MSVFAGNALPSKLVVPRELHPLSERILARLPGRRALWILAAAAVPWVNAGANVLLDAQRKSAIWEEDRVLVLLNYAALSGAVVLTIWGARRIADRLEALRATTARALDEGGSSEPFRGVGRVGPPLLGAVATALAFGASALAANGALAAVLRFSTWLVLAVAFWSFLWTYVSLHVGLDRLGRERVRAEAVRLDPALGLRPLGDAAFTGLWMLVAWLLPVLLTGLSDEVGVAIGLAVLGLGLALFFLSLVRLHRQMVEVKAGELAIARALYAEAYEPLRASPTLDVLERQRSLLAAADALEKRANALHDWPIDEGTFARVLTIATSVVAITIGRLILDPFGL